MIKTINIISEGRLPKQILPSAAKRASSIQYGQNNKSKCGTHERVLSPTLALRNSKNAFQQAKRRGRRIRNIHGI